MIRRRIALALVVVLAVLLAPSGGPAGARQQSNPTLNGGGSSFAKLEIDQWRAETARDPFNLRINYVAQGSSFGRQQYVAGNLDFAASDIPFTAQELQALQGRERAAFVYVPVSAGGLGFMYNLVDLNGQRVVDLKLTRRAVCRIFTEPGMLWTDPEIQGVNPELRLPAEAIRPIVRQDGSGTSYVLSEFCLTVAPDVWQAFIQRQRADTSLDPEFLAGRPTSNWPLNWGIVGAALAADGVAATVADPTTGRNAITYNEAGFAKVRNFPNASVQNAAGVFTLPTEDAVSLALGYAQGRPDGTFILNYTAGDPAAYFPSTYSYVIAQTTGFPQDKGNVLARFLCYAVTFGQRPELTQRLGYARLSPVLVDIARNSISKIPGAPPWESCAVTGGGAPPPPPPSTIAPAAAAVAPSGSSGSPAPAPGAPAGSTTAPTDPSSGAVVDTANAEETGAGTGNVAGVPAQGDTTSASTTTTPGSVASETAAPVTGPPVLALNPAVEPATGRVGSSDALWLALQAMALCAIGAALMSIRRTGAW